MTHDTQTPAAVQQWGAFRHLYLVIFHQASSISYLLIFAEILPFLTFFCLSIWCWSGWSVSYISEHGPCHTWMFPKTVHKRRKTKIVALIKSRDGWLEMASWLFLMVRCRQGHGSVRLLHTSVDIGLRENIYSVNTLHKQEWQSRPSCMKNIFHLEENMPK